MAMKKTAYVGRDCVACGCCVLVCPRQAIQIFKGKYAVVEATRCIGCGLCVKHCPASVLTVKEVQQHAHE